MSKTKSTFTFKNIGIYKKTSNVIEEILGIPFREVMRNAEEHNASIASVFLSSLNKKKYFVIASDADAFESRGHLEECLRPNTSGETTGVQGNGMKLAMFSCANKDEAELIVHSRSEKDIFTLRLTCDESNNAKIENVIGFNEDVQKLFGTYYEKFNVFVFYRVKSEIKKFNEKHIAVATDMTPTEKIKIEWTPFGTIGDAEWCNAKTYEQLMYNQKIGKRNKPRTKICLNNSEINHKFLIDSEKIEVKNVVNPINSDNTLMCNAFLEFLIYPGFYNKHGRLINLRKDENEIGEGNTYVALSKLGLCVFYDKEAINKRKIIGKNLDRMHTDPFYVAIHAQSLLNEIGIYVNREPIFPVQQNKIGRKSNVAKEQEFIKNRKKLDEYSYIDYFSDEQKDKIEKWIPILKIKITLSDSEGAKNTKIHDFVLDFGNINEFFLCDDRTYMGELLNNIFIKLGKDNPQELRDIRKRIKEHFPYEYEDKLPIPNILLHESRQIDFFENNDGELYKLKEVEPGKAYFNLVAKFKNGEEVKNNFDSYSKGYSFKKEGNNFDLVVSPLSEINDDGSHKTVSEENYKHTSKYFPRSNCTIEIGEDKYWAGFKCKTPEKDKKIIIKKKPSGEGTEEPKISEKWAEDKYYRGNVCEIGRYSSRGLLINECNPGIRKIIKASKDKIKGLERIWKEIYKKLDKISRVVCNEYYKPLDINFKGESREEMIDKYENERNCFLNTHLKTFFDNDSTIEKLLKDIDNVNDKIQDDDDYDIIEALAV